eukprot:TRINITY_DN5014_c0_g2_i1.p1 TRINITY_DN5014_c0_g2~~TRINITY_DN5014_c0_g2_i1.p1  ORF type:complete len:397 (+),score=70.48 TRINITY_DN5014_c0_g2_i1:105-1295(+)
MSAPFPPSEKWGTNVSDNFNKGSGFPLKNSNDVKLFTPLKIGGITLKNRIGVSPMCQYSCEDGFMNDFHLVHLGSFAKGGAGLVIFEASAVSAEGRITPWDSGIYKDEHAHVMKRIVDFIHSQKSSAGLQIAHAGRKSSTYPPYFTKARQPVPLDSQGWIPFGPSSLPFTDDSYKPHELTQDQIKHIIDDFVKAAKRANEAGFDLLEIHGAHGYLISSFNSPIANHRQDEYGGSFENRTRFCKEVVKAVREVWPLEKGLSIRLSCSDWLPDGWTIDDTVLLAKELKQLGIDIIDCSSGGNSLKQQIKEAPGYQVEFSERVRKEAGILTTAVGAITNAHQAEEIVKNERADLVLIGREFLREPYWGVKAATALGVEVGWVPQYHRSNIPTFDERKNI